MGSTISVYLPTWRNVVLCPSEFYLKFNATETNTNADAGGAAYRLDSCGAHRFSQRLRIFSGSNLLQVLDNYSLLAKVLFDLQVSTPSCYGKYNILAGCRADTMSNVVINTASATVGSDGTTAECL